MAQPASQRYQQQLTPHPDRLGPLRRVVADHVWWWGWPKIIHSTVLCTTELLTNVHQHTGSSCALLLEAIPQGIRITVSDSNPALPQMRQPDWCSESGRGMWLISHTAYAWGARSTDTGKDVWVELRPSVDSEQAAT